MTGILSVMLFVSWILAIAWLVMGDNEKGSNVRYLAAFLLLTIPLGLFADAASKSPTLAELKKAEWVCTATQNEQCTNYSRIQ